MAIEDFANDFENFKKDSLKADLEKHNPKEKDIQDIDPIFKRVYIVNGIRRSGNHICVDWIKSHLNGTVKPKTNSVLHMNDAKEPLYPPKTKSDQEYLIISHEDRRQLPLLYDFSKFGDSTKVYNINIIRDPRNNMASLMKCGLSHGLKVNETNFAEYWCDYYQMFKEFKIPGVVCVSFDYDRWISDREYRNRLAEQLGFKNLDLHVDIIASKGSSFTKKRSNNKPIKDFPGQTDFLNRWEEYKDDPVFQKVMSELREEIKVRKLSGEEYFSELII